MNAEHDFKYTDVTEKIIGCAMRIHSHFGLGFPEIIYKRSLIVELDRSGLRYKSEIEKDILYKGIFIGKRRLDLVVEDKILIEIKAITVLDKSCYNQVINYLRIFDLEVGLLLNFGTESLQFKRFAYSKTNQRNPLNNP